MLRFCIVLLLIASSLGLFSQNIVRNLSDESWNFVFNRDSRVYPAKIPGFVHLDLMRNNLISDPFYAANEKTVDWVDQSYFTYTVVFQVSNHEMKSDYIELVFDGIDTYAHVFLNDSEILQSDNMFIQHRINVKNLLRKGENRIQIHFSPASLINLELEKNDLISKPDGHRIFSRKAQYMFGWDWGPKLISAGVWKDVNLIFWNKAQISELTVNQISISDKEAQLEIQAYFNAESYKNLKVKIEIIDPDSICNQFLISEFDDSLLIIKRLIRNPKLWWTHDLGKQNLYKIKMSLFDGNDFLEKKEINIGLRTIELIQSSDSLGRSFYFVLNGKPIFSRGVNLIPFHHFPSEVANTDYAFYLDKVVEANMNMVRVWGGGIYESDAFYNKCDEKGILVWQDFMFAGAMYPSDSQFVQSVSLEVSQQVKRLRHHASLALWCGNNEISEAWHNWGWQKQFGYSTEDSLKLISDYQFLFEKVIPNILQKLDPQRYYHPSSPTTGWGRTESYRQGDVHYWGVWWGLETLEMYQKKVGRFVSEFGFQGMPAKPSFDKFIPKNEMFMGSSSVMSHQKHPTGYQTISTYLKRDFYVDSTDFEQQIYLSQLLQARALKIAIESQRATKPYCMGSLIWQLNDCWPVTSWSLIDFYKIPKAAYFQVKRSFSAILPVILDSDSILILKIVSDLPQNQFITAEYGFYNFNGKPLFIDSFSLDLPMFSADKYLTINKSNVILNFNSIEKYFFYLKILVGDSLVAEQFHFFQKPNEMNLQKPIVNFKIIDNQYVEVFSSNIIVKNLQLETEGVYFEDNFFDLFPKQSRRIKYQTLEGKLLDVSAIKWKSFYTN